jgi:hypothetical protein
LTRAMIPSHWGNIGQASTDLRSKPRQSEHSPVTIVHVPSIKVGRVCLWLRRWTCLDKKINTKKDHHALQEYIHLTLLLVYTPANGADQKLTEPPSVSFRSGTMECADPYRPARKPKPPSHPQARNSSYRTCSCHASSSLARKALSRSCEGRLPGGQAIE